MQAGAQSTEPHQPGQLLYIFMILVITFAPMFTIHFLFDSHSAVPESDTERSYLITGEEEEGAIGGGFRRQMVNSLGREWLRS